MSVLTDFLRDLFQWLIDSLWNALVDLINAVIVAFCTIFTAIINLLPTTAVSSPGPVTDSTFLSTINWFLPIGHIVTSLGVYATAMLLYFGIGPLLRLIKVI